MIKLTDTQRILLSSASRRDDGSIYPLPSTLKPGGGTTKAVEALVTRGFAQELETSDALAVRRVDGDIRWGVFMTAAGSAAIGVETASPAGEDAGTALPAPAAPVAPKAPTKAAAVQGLLERPDGATLAELIGATGWLPHTTRAALTGIRKKGHAVERGKRGDVSCYRIVSAA